MCGSERTIDLGFTTEPYAAGAHMCLIYSEDRQRRQVIGRFLQSGLSSGEKVAYFGNQARPEAIVDFLKELRVDVSQHSGGALTVSKATSTYCPDGTFVPDRMIDTLRTFYETSASEGFPGCRVSGEMAWALDGMPGSARLMEYEALVNTVVATHPVTAICQYDANRFDGHTILQCLEVHPYMIVHGQIVHNPFFLQPEDYLKAYLR